MAGSRKDHLAAMYCVISFVSAGLGSMGGWQESAPSTRAEPNSRSMPSGVEGMGSSTAAWFCRMLRSWS